MSTLKRIFNKIQSLEADLDAIIESRSNTWNTRSNDWQQGDKGQEHDEITTVLSELWDECSRAIHDLNDLIED